MIKYCVVCQEKKTFDKDGKTQIVLTRTADKDETHYECRVCDRCGKWYRNTVLSSIGELSGPVKK